jgi:hypothetical protein
MRDMGCEHPSSFCGEGVSLTHAEGGRSRYMEDKPVNFQGILLTPKLHHHWQTGKPSVYKPQHLAPTPSVPHTPINFPTVKRVVPALWDLTHHPPRPSGHNTEAWNNHIRRDNRALEDAHKVLDDGKLAHDGAGPDRDVVAN